MANALLNAWQTGNDAILENDVEHRMNYRTNDPYGQLRDSLIPTLMGNYNTAMANRGRGPQMRGFMNTIGGGGPFREVSENPIWSQNQIQQRVNQARSQSDQQRDTAIRNQQANLSSRGFATANSPMAMAMAEQTRGLAMAGNARMENDLKWNVALGNAQHVQGAQMANAANQLTHNANNLRARLAGLEAFQNERNRWDAQNDPNPFMNQLLNLLQVARPERELFSQMDDNQTGWRVDRRTLA